MPQWEWVALISGAIAMLSAFWSRAQGVLAWFRGWFLITKKANVATSTFVVSYLDHVARRGRREAIVYGSDHAFVRPLERKHRVFFERLDGANQRWWFRWRPVWFVPTTMNYNESNEALRDYCNQFRYVRGTLDWEKLLLEAATWEAEERVESRASRFRIVKHHAVTSMSQLNRGANSRRSSTDDEPGESPTGRDWTDFGIRLIGWKLADVISPAAAASIELLSLNTELLTLSDEIDFWFGSREWYALRGIPWRRGYVFKGRPGTGKTSYARAKAEQLGIPIHVFDLAGMSNHDFDNAWSAMLADTPCMALFEDLDGVFEGRKAKGKGGLTFDQFLNCLDGIERVDGVITVVSTNLFETLDEALVDRPGRIDRVVEFLPLDHEGRRKLAARILQDDVAADVMALEGVDDSAAQFQERCFRAALEKHFADAPRVERDC